MSRLYEVEMEPEVRSWLAGLTDRDFGRVDFLVGLLAEHAEEVGEPYARHLGGKVRGVTVPSATPADADHILASARTTGDLIDSVPQNPWR